MERRPTPTGNNGAGDGWFGATILLICGLDAIRKSCGPYGPIFAGGLGCIVVIVAIVLIIVFSTQTLEEGETIVSSNSSIVSFFRHGKEHNDPYGHTWTWWFFDWWWILVVVVIFGFGAPFLFWTPQQYTYVRATAVPAAKQPATTTTAATTAKPTAGNTGGSAGADAANRPLLAVRV